MSKNSEKKLCEYINILEKLIMNLIENTQEKNSEVDTRIDKLKNLLAKRGITPEEIENVLAINEPYDKNLELLKNDLINENISLESNDIEVFQQQNFKDNMDNFFCKNHLKFENMGINLEEEEK